MSIIKAEALTKEFGSVKALDRLDLDVKEGEIFALVGPDGAGKTTTMRLLSAIMDPTSGKAFVDGSDVVLGAEEIKTKIGTMSQKFGLYHDLTVLENIEFYADIYGIAKKGRKEKIDFLLNFSNLAPFKDRLADKLSGGMKQKLGLCTALIHKPKILLLDEPTNGVDPVSRRDFWRILYQLHREKVTIFFSTSYMDEAQRAGRLAFLHEGKLLACGKVEEIKKIHKGSLLEICVKDPKKVYGIFRVSQSFPGARLIGNRIHLQVEDPANVSTLLNNFLKKNGISGYQIGIVEPSLEDVFVSMSKGASA